LLTGTFEKVFLTLIMQTLLKLNYRYSFYSGYKLGCIGAACSFHHSFQLLLPFSSSLGLQLYFQRPCNI